MAYLMKLIPRVSNSTETYTNAINTFFTNNFHVIPLNIPLFY